MKILVPLSFFKSFWFIKAGVHLTSNAFLVTNHKNENTACGRSLWMAPSGPHLRVFMTCVLCAPWVWAVPSGFLLMNRGQQKWWDVISKIRLQKDLLPSCFVPLPSDLLALREPAATLWAVLQRGPHATEKGPQWTACKELNPDNNHMSKLGKRPHPTPPKSSLQMRPELYGLTTSLLGMLSQRHPANMGPDSGSTESMR